MDTHVKPYSQGDNTIQSKQVLSATLIFECIITFSLRSSFVYILLRLFDFFYKQGLPVSSGVVKHMTTQLRVSLF